MDDDDDDDDDDERGARYYHYDDDDDVGAIGTGRAADSFVRVPEFASADARADPVDTADVERFGRVVQSAHRERENLGVFIAEFAQGFLAREEEEDEQGEDDKSESDCFGADEGVGDAGEERVSRDFETLRRRR